ncbi:MAG: DUF3035 domain-containing protein [Alphaproteobacteria bacterium]|nr:DUF3035 domain-containing protein [Alphaproteobacteria bacterium]
MYARHSLLALGLATLVLGGCADLRPLGEAVGVVPSQEQEQYNVNNARLSLPPDFNLRPPQAGSGVAQARAATSRGQTAVFGDKRRTTARTREIRQATRSDGESALLRKAAGNQRVDSAVRDTVDQETTGAAESERQFTDKLLKWRPASGGEQSEDGEDRPADATDRYTPVVTKK